MKLHFPRRWNDLQKWDMQFSAERMLCTIMIHYVDFFDGMYLCTCIRICVHPAAHLPLNELNSCLCGCAARVVFNSYKS